jgi:hypothetical protein
MKDNKQSSLRICRNRNTQNILKCPCLWVVDQFCIVFLNVYNEHYYIRSENPLTNSRRWSLVLGIPEGSRGLAVLGLSEGGAAGRALRASAGGRRLLRRAAPRAFGETGEEREAPVLTGNRKAKARPGTVRRRGTGLSHRQTAPSLALLTAGCGRLRGTVSQPGRREAERSACALALVGGQKGDNPRSPLSFFPGRASPLTAGCTRAACRLLSWDPCPAPVTVLKPEMREWDAVEGVLAAASASF